MEARNKNNKTIMDIEQVTKIGSVRAQPTSSKKKIRRKCQRGGQTNRHSRGRLLMFRRGRRGKHDCNTSA